MGRDLQQNAAALQVFLRTLPAGTVHLVAFSLGGLVVRALFHFYPQQHPGRIVTLGTPHNGSLAAQRLVRWRWSCGESVSCPSGAPRSRRYTEHGY